MTEKPEVPSGLKARGAGLWNKVTETTKFDAAGYAMLEDACRTADIIDGALKSKHQEWVRLIEDDEVVDLDRETTCVKVLVVVNPILGEIRQQRLALRQMLAHLHIGKVSGGSDATKQSFWASIEETFANS